MSLVPKSKSFHKVTKMVTILLHSQKVAARVGLWVHEIVVVRHRGAAGVIHESITGLPSSKAHEEGHDPGTLCRRLPPQELTGSPLPGQFRDVTIHHELLQSWILNCLRLWYISWYSKSIKYHLVQYRNNYLFTRTAEIIYNMCMLDPPKGDIMVTIISLYNSKSWVPFNKLLI